jgi:hypothetical protein
VTEPNFLDPRRKLEHGTKHNFLICVTMNNK